MVNQPQKLMGWESFCVSNLTFDQSFKIKGGEPNLKVLITCLLLVLQVWGVPTHRKS